MPELPEVHTVVNSIRNKIIDKKIIDYAVFDQNTCYNNNTYEVSKKIVNKTIINVLRFGKNIVIQLDNSFLVFHLRMTGYLYHASKQNRKSKHLRYLLELSDNSFLIFEDIRKFGGFYYLKNLNNFKNRIGKDPFDSTFTKSWLLKTLLSKKSQIKSLLLRQDYICGLGNIYIDEILWKSKIHPRKKTNTISEKKIISLHKNIISTLNESISFHGTTFMNFKFDNMKTGNYKSKLNVYGRKNKPCKKCHKKIITVKVCGRTSHYCSNCQR